MIHPDAAQLLYDLDEAQVISREQWGDIARSVAYTCFVEEEQLEYTQRLVARYIAKELFERTQYSELKDRYETGAGYYATPQILICAVEARFEDARTLLASRGVFTLEQLLGWARSADPEQATRKLVALLARAELQRHSG